MRTPRSLAVVAAALLAATLSACGTTEDGSSGDGGSGGQSITLTDARGKAVTLDGPAVRVAGTEWNVVEYLVSLGVQPVGVADIEGFQTWDSAVELDGSATDIGTRGEPSFDTLAQLNLDALFVTDELAGDAIAQIEKTIPVIVVPGGDADDPIDQIFSNIDLVAKATGTEDEAAALREEFDGALADAKEAVQASPIAGSPVALNDAYDTGSAIFIRPYLEGSQLGALLSELGFENAWAGIGIEGDGVYGLGQTDVEGLTKLPADTVFWYIGGGGAADVYTEVLADNAVWTSLPFVKAGSVSRIPDQIWMFGGPESMIQFLDAVVAAVAAVA